MDGMIDNTAFEGGDNCRRKYGERCINKTSDATESEDELKTFEEFFGLVYYSLSIYHILD